MAVYSRIKTWVSNEVLTASDLNAEFNNIITNAQPSGIEDASADVSSMQATTDPGGVGSESLATTLLGEIQRLRFVIKRIVGGAQWYSTPSFDLTTASIGTSNLASEAVTTAKIASEAVTTAKIASEAVTTAKIATGAVTTAKIDTGAVTRVKMVAVGQVVATGSGSYSTSSTSITTITNQSIGITTTGRPVMCIFQGDGSGTSYMSIVGSTSSSTAEVGIYRDATQVASVQLRFDHSSTSATYTGRGFLPLVALDVVSAGTYTYTARVTCASGTTFYAEKCKLIVYEL